MPDIDPAALGRSDSTTNGSATPSISVKILPGGIAAAQKQSKPVPSAPRVDLEQIYTSLKSIIGEHWTTYKEVIGRFVLGHLNQGELARLTDHFIAIDPIRERLHNQLICGVYANALRDVPDQPVAVWVSANDKPAVLPKPASGDAAEQRLKVEVMQLPPRFRQRLKGVQDEPFNRITHELLIHAHAKRIQPILPSTAPSSLATPATATSATGLNTELDIRKRYSLPLATETRDLPGSSALTDRLVPMCYEEGLPSGLGNAAPCLDLLSTGLETFIKEVVSSVLGRSRTDAPISGPDLATSLSSGGPSLSGVPAPVPAAPPSFVSTVGLGSARMASGIMTSRYKERLQVEELAFARGELKRSEAGLLPIELTASKANHELIGAAGDLRIAWETGEPWLLAMMPWLGEKVAVDEYSFMDLDQDGLDEDITMADALSSTRSGGIDHRLNGFMNGTGLESMAVGSNLPKVNGFAMTNGDHDETGVTAGDDLDCGWQGASASDRTVLSSLLEDCLAFGQ